MGFTLRAALTVLGSKAKIVVSELVPAVVARARGPMAQVFGDSLDDVRVSIRETDVGEIIRAQRSAFDAILLDVDNGPEGLTRKGNDALYNASGLKAAKTALRTSGVLAVWSSGPNPAFTKRLGSAGSEVNEVNIRATGRGGGARHVIWLARKSQAACPATGSIRQNIVLLFAGFSGIGCTTSQCSTTLPFSSLKMSTIALPLLPGSRTA